MGSIYLPYQKPPRWNIDRATVVYNCAWMGLPGPGEGLELAMPTWEGAGSKVFDYSGNRNHGNIVGATWKNNGLDFDGNDYVDIAHSAELEPPKITVAVIYRGDRSVQYEEVIRKGNNSGVDSWEIIRGYPSAGDVRFSIYDGVWRPGPFYPLVIGTTYHIVGTYDGSTIRLYVNGVERGTPVSYSGAVNQSGDVVNIGRRSSGDRYIDGGVFASDIWSVALSASQVQTLHNNPYGMFELARKSIWIVPLGPTTTAPTTLAPTTLAPTTLAPTTLAPTTLPPTTLAPTTEAPTTPVYTTIGPTTVHVATTPIPTTAAPTTLAPTTLAPTSLAPTTIAPTTLAPTTLVPTTLQPTTLAPTSLPPTTLAPTSLPPTTLAPTTPYQTTAAPTTLAPTTLKPTTIPPTTLQPTTLLPTTLAPTTVGPTTIPSSTIVPTTLAPTTLGPTVPPTTNIPELICIKEFNSVITNEIPLRSLITKEIRSDGHLC